LKISRIFHFFHSLAEDNREQSWMKQLRTDLINDAADFNRFVYARGSNNEANGSRVSRPELRIGLTLSGRCEPETGGWEQSADLSNGSPQNKMR
jgi:hypothetical protein